MVNQYERAYHAWAILTDAAARRECEWLTYKDLAKRIGVHHRPLRYVLGLIQDYCLCEKLPPLTILAVSQSTLRPGVGFIAWDADDIEQGREQVFGYPWRTQPNPFAFAAGGASYEGLVNTVAQSPEKSEEVYARIRVRGIAQQVFRDALLRVYDSKCAFTGFQFEVCLDAAHIIPWSEATPAQRMDVRNGILMSAVHHRLFDQRRMTVDEDYRIRFYDPRMLDDPPYSESDRSLTAALNGKKMLLPWNKDYWPNPEWIKRRNMSLGWECS